MNLVSDLVRQINNPTLSRDERALVRCVLAKELEDAGDYEAARGAMGELWRLIGEHPSLHDLEARTAAAVLMRAGALT